MASEYLKWKYKDVRPDTPAPRTRRQKAANWWHYHKWWLLVGAALLAALVDIGWNALGIGAVKPDYQVALVSSFLLDDETLHAIEGVLSTLGEDCNGDGRVTVQVHVYADLSDSQDSDAARYTAAAKVKLMADMESCDSYFFLCEYPETLHANYEILARADGEIAGAADAIDATPWADCPALAALDVGEPLSRLNLCRRCFWGERTCSYRSQCDALWTQLTEESAP